MLENPEESLVGRIFMPIGNNMHEYAFVILTDDKKPSLLYPHLDSFAVEIRYLKSKERRYFSRASFLQGAYVPL